MGKSLKWAGLGGIDKLFGFIFGGITGYFYCVIILSLSNYIYLYDKWPAYLKNGSSYNVIEYGRKLFDEKILFSNEYIDETKKNLEALRFLMDTGQLKKNKEGNYIWNETAKK